MRGRAKRFVSSGSGLPDYELHEWHVVAGEPRGGTGACVAAYVDWVEAGWGNHQELALLVALIRSVDWRTGKTKPPYYPSVALLARRAGMSERQAKRVLADLVKASLVKRTRRSRERGGKAPSAYELFVPVLIEIDEEGRDG